MDFTSQLKKANQELSQNGVNLRIECRGSLLNIRGPLPCRDNKGEFKIQRISLRINANLEGLKEAQKLIELIRIQVEHEHFEWDHWSKSSSQKSSTGISTDTKTAIEKFKEHFFSDPLRKKSTSGAKTTWNSSYLPYMRRLGSIADESKKQIDSNLLLQTLTSYRENSRSRQQCGTALSALSNFLGNELPKDWRAQSGGYGIHKAKFRVLPSDQSIIETYKKIPNLGWQFVYALMATYGLRNHEVFFCDLSSLTKTGDKVLRVLPNTKTGEHQVWPFPPEWIDLFKLDTLGENPYLLPSITKDLKKTTLQNIGRRVSEQFSRYNLALTPYNLRHAWAIRTIHIGLPDTVSARMMGHSVSIHTKTYHHWITRRDQQNAVDSALKRNQQKLQ